jgi:hypothetical protein
LKLSEYLEEWQQRGTDHSRHYQMCSLFL